MSNRTLTQADAQRIGAVVRVIKMAPMDDIGVVGATDNETGYEYLAIVARDPDGLGHVPLAVIITDDAFERLTPFDLQAEEGVLKGGQVVSLVDREDGGAA